MKTSGVGALFCGTERQVTNPLFAFAMIYHILAGRYDPI